MPRGAIDGNCRLIVTGATGNTGSHVIRRLRASHPRLAMLALVRRARSAERNDVRQLRELGVAVEEFDAQSPESIADLIEPSDIFLEMANLRIADILLPLARRAGCRRAFCVTTTGVFSVFNAYSRVYQDIEARMRESGLMVTILRPSMIYGNDRDHNMRKLLAFIDRYPVFPIFGDGTSLMQPVHVEDLAAGICSAVERNATGEFNLAGPQPIRYIDLLRICAATLGRNVHFVHVPHAVAAAMAGFLERVPGFPISREQVMRLTEDKAYDIGQSIGLLDYSPREFDEGIHNQVARLRSLGLLRSKEAIIG